MSLILTIEIFEISKYIQGSVEIVLVLIWCLMFLRKKERISVTCGFTGKTDQTDLQEDSRTDRQTNDTLKIETEEQTDNKWAERYTD